MKAWQLAAAGERPQLTEVVRPEVVAGSVLVRIKAAGLNAVDNAIAAGTLAQVLPHEYPLVLGRDAAGIVAAVGEGVEGLTQGDQVFGNVLIVPPIKAGTLAEFALLPAEAVALKPAGVDFVTAAALPLAAAAAFAAVAAVEPASGQVVLVNGASGGVGSFAIQLLVASGATVIATGKGHDVERLAKLGADRVVDFTAGSVADQVLALYPIGVDVLVNLAGYTEEQVPLAAVRRGGKVASTTQVPSATTLAAAGLTGGAVFAAPVREVIAALANQVAAGTLAVDIAAVLPFGQAAEGLRLLQSGEARGKIVVTVDSE